MPDSHYLHLISAAICRHFRCYTAPRKPEPAGGLEWYQRKALHFGAKFGLLSGGAGRKKQKAAHEILGG